VPKDLSTYFAEEGFQDKNKKILAFAIITHKRKKSELTRENGKSKKCTLSHLLHYHLILVCCMLLYMSTSIKNK
jgi:hypothetical protein